MRHALLLVKTRFLRPRNSRGESAICPAKWPRRCPQPRSVRVRSGAASSPCPRPRPQTVRGQSMSVPVPAAANVRVLAVGRPCLNTWLAGNCPCCGFVISRVMSRQRLRHFPRECLIARLTSGEASIVKVEVAGHYGETTLTTRSEPHNRRAIHAEPEVNPARMRTGHGDG